MVPASTACEMRDISIPVLLPTLARR